MIHPFRRTWLLLLLAPLVLSLRVFTTTTTDPGKALPIRDGAASTNTV